MVTGKFLVDVFPALRFLPEWLPGGGFKTLAREWAKAFDDMVDVPYNFAWQQIVRFTLHGELLKIHPSIVNGNSTPLFCVSRTRERREDYSGIHIRNQAYCGISLRR